MPRRMQDVQNERDDRRIPIAKAGIKHLLYPIVVLDRENKRQPTVADVSLYVDLPHHFKGTHMSRFVEVLNEHRGLISLRTIETILATIIRRFDSSTAHLEIRFPYFVEKAAPVSGARSLMNYQCAFLAAMDRRRRPVRPDLVVEVAVPVGTLCPCSKAISDQGAHNQRSRVTIQIRSANTLAAIQKFMALHMIVLGTLQLLAATFGAAVREHARCWLRTPSGAMPSDFISRTALANVLREYLRNVAKNPVIAIIRRKQIQHQNNREKTFDKQREVA